MPSKELDAKSTTPLAGLVNTPTKPLPTPATVRIWVGWLVGV